MNYHCHTLFYLINQSQEAPPKEYFNSKILENRLKQICQNNLGNNSFL